MRHTTRMMDIIERSLNGPLMEEEEFNLTVTQGIRRVVKEYDIKVDRETLINQDDALADRVWNAAVDFLSETGVYCQTTNRVIKHTVDEIYTILRDAPAEVWHGGGNDRVLERYRPLDVDFPALLMGSPIGTPICEDHFIPAMMSYIQEPLVDVTCAASITTTHGYDIRTRSPLEILAAWEEVDLMKIALARAGRPEMAWTGVIMSISDVGQLSTVNPAGLRKTDMFTFGIVSELKVNFDVLNKMAHGLRLGYTIDPYANPIYGGLGGGIDGQAVLITAAMIALNVVCMATCCGSSPTHPFNFNDTGAELLQAQSASFQALARNSHLLTNLTNTPVGGPATKTLLYECVAFTIMCNVSGCSRILGPRSATGSIEAKFSGLEARFSGELLHASAGMSRAEAEEIVQKAYALYVDDLDKQPYGKEFHEAYDLKSIQPTAEWEGMYEEVKNEVAGWGVNFK